ncbi:MAG: hypothetical protein SGBAC_010630 [Bacillariaceae sp.]
MTSGFQAPTIRHTLTVVTPPETPSRNHNAIDGNRRKRQRSVKACEDESLCLPYFSDLEAPVRFPRQRRSKQIQKSMLLSSTRSSSPAVLPSRHYEDDSPAVVFLAPRFESERIIDGCEVSANKRFKLTSTAKSAILPFEL